MQPFELSISEAGQAIRAGELSPRELLESAVGRLRAVEPDVNAFASTAIESARLAAARAEEEISQGNYRGTLHGIPFGVKDLIDVAGMDTAAGSRVLAGNRAHRDAAAVQGLRDAGAVILGKTHTHEFAFGLITPASRNPHALGRITGGSSGGSAAALASHSVAGALGTDTGGSIRVPSSLCGVVGLKPTYGLVPMRGVTPLSWSLDHVGPMARTEIGRAHV